MMRTYQSRPLLTTESEVTLAAYALRYRVRHFQRPAGRSQRAIQSVPHGTGRPSLPAQVQLLVANPPGITVRPASANG